MAYGAYQLSQPRKTLLSSLVQSQFGPSIDPRIKKKQIMDEFRKLMMHKQKFAQKRGKKWEDVTTALDIAAGFVDPGTAAIIGAVSGGLSGYDQMKAYEKLRGAGSGYERYGFLRPQVADIQKQIKGRKKGYGDVVVSAGTQALKNFIGAKAGETVGGADRPSAKLFSGKGSWLDNMDWSSLTPDEVTKSLAGMSTQFAGPLEAAGQYGKPVEKELDLTRLY